VDGSLTDPDRAKLGGRSTDSTLHQWWNALTNTFTPIGTDAVSAFSAFGASESRSGIEAVLLPLRSILCLLHRDLVDM
jgi:hypothetical protein